MGLGIPAEHLESIFEPFFTTKRDTGTGLGLWVSRELVEKHGGSLRVRSRTSDPLCGTIFSIFLPSQGKLEAMESFSTNDHAEASRSGFQ
jgi:signal transduction histidine kinase